MKQKENKKESNRSNRRDERQQYFFVIRELTGREIKRKYTRSYLGILWSIFNPLLYMVVMSLIFSQMFKTSIDKFPTYFLTAYVFWTLFSVATETGMTALVDNRALLLKVKLPKQTFILSRIYTSLVNFGFICIAYVAVLIFYRVEFHWTVLLFPIDVIFALLFTTGITYILAILYVFHRDIKFLYVNLLILWDHLIAMYYPIEMLSPIMQKVVGWNPIYVFVKIARDCVLYGRVSEKLLWIQMIFWGIGTLFVGYVVFKCKENRVMQLL